MRHGQHNALVVATVVFALGLAGCGGKVGAPTRARTAVPRSTPHLAGLPPATQAPASTEAPVAATPTAAPAPSPAASSLPEATATPSTAVAPSLVSVSVAPLVVNAGGTVTVSARTAGAVSRLVLYLSAGPAAYNASYPLGRSAPHSWSGTIPAPPAPGSYHYTLSLFDASGVAHAVDNDAWTLRVRGGPTATAAVPSVPATIPADIPLVPPFSYSNPTPATFAAEGQTLSGAEVVSDSRPDIKASTVAQWYLARYPRAGWTVDARSIPPPGATTFTIVASQGGRVSAVSYANGTVTVFYTLAAG